ncbi:MAG TPA: transcription antitermination factor NusB, partial [Polyangia bacterium]
MTKATKSAKMTKPTEAARAAKPGQGSPVPSARALARGVLDRVERDGAYAGRALAAALDRARAMSPEDRALATELVYGVLRRRARLDRALDAFAKTGTSGLDPAVRIALRTAAYQILFLDRVPDYAAVDEAVETCKSAGGRGVAGFANALLRRLARSGEPPLPDAAADPAGYLEAAIGFPPWLARLALAELPAADALAFGETVVAPAPLTLRANTTRVSREALLTRLAAERPGAALAASAIAPDAILARRFDAPATTAAWREGLFAVQDAGAQVVAELCGAEA